MKKITACLVGLLSFFAIPSVAFAGSNWGALSPPDPPIDPSGQVVPTDTIGSIRVSAQLITLLVGAVIPLLVGLLSTYKSKHQGALMILMNVANSLIVTATMADGTAVFSQQMIVNVIPGVVGSLMAYYGLYKPNGITSSPVPIPGEHPGDTVMVPGKLSSIGIKP